MSVAYEGCPTCGCTAHDRSPSLTGVLRDLDALSVPRAAHFSRRELEVLGLLLPLGTWRTSADGALLWPESAHPDNVWRTVVCRLYPKLERTPLRLHSTGERQGGGLMAVYHLEIRP